MKAKLDEIEKVCYSWLEECEAITTLPSNLFSSLREL